MAGQRRSFSYHASHLFCLFSPPQTPIPFSSTSYPLFFVFGWMSTTLWTDIFFSFRHFSPQFCSYPTSPHLVSPSPLPHLSEQTTTKPKKKLVDPSFLSTYLSSLNPSRSSLPFPLEAIAIAIQQ